MRRRMFLGKIHRAVITHADLHYEGSCTIDADLMEAAGMIEHEELHVWNVTRGTRLVTYTLAGPRGSGVICINGAAAHHNADAAQTLERLATALQSRVARFKL